jgi:hypothetical protein
MVIDTDMANDFDKLSPDDMDDLGHMLSRDEVNARKQVLQGIKEHIAALPDKCKIDPGDWGGDIAGMVSMPGDSYAERDKRLQR